jgi:hypothetical protein
MPHRRNSGTEDIADVQTRIRCARRSNACLDSGRRRYTNGAFAPGFMMLPRGLARPAGIPALVVRRFVKIAR